MTGQVNKGLLGEKKLFQAKCPECGKVIPFEYAPGMLNIITCRSSRHLSQPEIDFVFMPDTPMDADYAGKEHMQDPATIALQANKYNSPLRRALGGKQ